jgi:hypothetical protein
MCEELEPVGAQGFVLRRVHPSYYKAGLAIPIQRGAFVPTQNDTTGISVYRERFTRAPADVLRAVKEEKRGLFYVARLQVRDLAGLGLTVVPDPYPEDIPGHCVIPQLSRANYDADYDRLAEVQVHLARLASQDIVLRPAS